MPGVQNWQSSNAGGSGNGILPRNCLPVLDFHPVLLCAQLEWESIFSGRYSDDQIMNRRHKRMKVQHDAGRASFPDGLATRETLFAQPEQEAREYFTSTYGVYYPGKLYGNRREIWSGKSTIMPSVTVRISMPAGAAIPAESAPTQTNSGHSPSSAGK